METNIDPATGVIVKSDQTGRIRYTPEYKRKVLAAFESSSLSATVFAKQCGIKYPTLAAWIGTQKRVIKQHREGTLRLSSLPRLHHPAADRRWKFNYSAGPSSAHRMWSRPICSPRSHATTSVSIRSMAQPSFLLTNPPPHQDPLLRWNWILARRKTS